MPEYTSYVTTSRYAEMKDIVFLSLYSVIDLIAITGIEDKNTIFQQRPLKAFKSPALQ